MASILGHSPHFFLLLRKSPSPHLLLSSNPRRTLNPPPFSALRASRTHGRGLGGGVREGSAMLRRPVVSLVVSDEVAEEEKSVEEVEVDERIEEAEWVDWEDQILEETVPLVGFVRMILHSGKYAIGERLSPDHEKTILEKLLLYHPECEKKTGCGVEYINVELHPEFEESRCLFIVRKDGQTVDFSYWKCIKGLIKKKYPLYADSFIRRHFRRPRPPTSDRSAAHFRAFLPYTRYL